MEAKKAEVRKRLEEQSASKKKKGFMTPERKKKLRVRRMEKRIRSEIFSLVVCAYRTEDTSRFRVVLYFWIPPSPISLSEH